MGQLSDALLSAGRQLEIRFRAHRHEMEAGRLRDVFPQTWRFETESEFAVLRLDADGRVSVAADALEPPAVLVRWDHERLVRTLLSGRSNEVPRDPPPTIRFTSDRGRRAFSLLGTSLGL